MSTDVNAFLPARLFGEVLSQKGAVDGLSGATVRAVTTTQGTYSLRIYHGDRALWRRSLGLQRLAADSGIAPPILHVDREAQAIVSQQIAGVPFSVVVSQPSSYEAALRSLAGILARLHSLPVPDLQDTQALEFAEGTWASQFQRAGFPVWARPLSNRLTRARESIALDGRRVLTHGDLNPTNVLWDGTRVWLVDWDGAGLGHPYLDVASAADFLNLSDEAAIAVLAMQEQSELDTRQRETFKDCRDLSRIAFGGTFLRLIPDLTQVEFPSRHATPTLLQCFARIIAGDLSISTIKGQALVGAAFYRLCDGLSFQTDGNE
ncbi:MAG TPA: phosphotransferase [Steroidobacteraceae bacterium]|nr:phosphotransferase [Steroidobacteraceae bacterium]